MTKETRGVGAIAGRVGRAFQRLPSPVRATVAEVLDSFAIPILAVLVIVLAIAVGHTNQTAEACG